MGQFEFLIRDTRGQKFKLTHSHVLTSIDTDRHPDLRAAAEQAKLLLKNRLEVDDSKHHFHSELGRITD